MSSSNSYEYKLLPKLSDQSVKPFRVSLKLWGDALKLGRAGGYNAPETTGLSKANTAAFVEAIRLALKLGKVACPDPEGLADLLDFLTGDGRQGFSVKRGFKDARTELGASRNADPKPAPKSKTKPKLETEPAPTPDSHDETAALAVLAGLAVWHEREPAAEYKLRIARATQFLRREAPDVLRVEARLADGR